MAKTKKPASKRRTAQVFDLTFKRLLQLSNRAVISFINGLFGAKHPLDAPVIHLKTDSVGGKLKASMSDSIISIGGVVYHVEAQIDNDTDMIIRVFQYSLAFGLGQKTREGDVRTINFPQVRVLYWETTGHEAAPQRLRLNFPDGGHYDYKLDAFDLLSHPVAELEKRGMAIVMPFYVLKLRKQIKAAATSLERKKLAKPMGSLLEQLLSALAACEKKGYIDYTDLQRLVEYQKLLYEELYMGYTEFDEEENLMNVKIRLYSEIAAEEALVKVAENLLSRGMKPEDIAHDTGLSLRKVKSLLTKKDKTPA